MTTKNEIGMKSKQRDRFLHSRCDREGGHGGGEFDLKKELALAVLIVV
jgi:hypothetical protein